MVGYSLVKEYHSGRWSIGNYTHSVWVLNILHQGVWRSDNSTTATTEDRAIHHADKLYLIRSTETVLPEHATFMQMKPMKVYTPVVMLDQYAAFSTNKTAELHGKILDCKSNRWIYRSFRHRGQLLEDSVMNFPRIFLRAERILAS